MNLLQLRSEFSGTPVVTCAKHKVQQFLECRCMARRAAKNGFQQPDGFLSQAIAGE
jgi:hypothetical protein